MRRLITVGEPVYAIAVSLDNTNLGHIEQNDREIYESVMRSAGWVAGEHDVTDRNYMRRDATMPVTSYARLPISANLEALMALHNHMLVHPYSKYPEDKLVVLEGQDGTKLLLGAEKSKMRFYQG